MSITYTQISIYVGRRRNQWSQHTLYSDATRQRDPTPQYRPAPPSTPSVSYRVGDKSDRRYTNNSSVGGQKVLDEKRRDHLPSSYRQERIAKAHHHSRTRPPEQRRALFEEFNDHRHLTNHSRNSNSARYGRNPDDIEYRAGHHKKELQQEAARRLRTRIAEPNAETISRPVSSRRRVEFMNPCGQECPTGEPLDMAPEEEAQRERLRERMQLKRRLTVGGSSGGPGKTGTYRFE